MKRNLKSDLKRAALQNRGLLDRNHNSLSVKKTLELARKNEISLRAVEIQALRNQIIPERYSKNVLAVGIEGQIKLLKSQVSVVGVGGLGGTALEHLARLGIGKIVVIDGDDFVDSNLNRQLLSDCQNIGKSKVLEARKRINSVNPAIEIRIFNVPANEKNLPGMIKNSRVVLDGLDDIRARFGLEKICKKMRIPLIHAAVAGFAGQVMTIYPEDKGLRQVYGSRCAPVHGIEIEQGVVCVAPALAAAIQVSEVIKILLGRPDTLQNKVLFFELKKHFIEIFDFAKD